jgi:hypothetical protein
MNKSVLQEKVIPNAINYFNARSDSEKRLLTITFIITFIAILYKSSWIVSSIQEKYATQRATLEQVKAQAALYTHETRSPLLTYLDLKSKVENTERKFDNKLRAQGDIATVEQLLKKHVGEKYFTLEDLPQQTFQGDIIRTPFKISFKTGSLETVAQVLSDLEQGKKTFSVSSLKIEKNYQKYLQVNIDASSLKKE